MVEARAVRRVVPLSTLLLTVALVGCLGDAGDDDGGRAAGNGFVVPAREDADAAGPFSVFLCKDGYRLPQDAIAEQDRCNHRVTRPLVDPDTLDVVGQHGPANEVSIAVNPRNPLELAGGGKDYTVSYVSDVAQCGEYTVWMGTYWSTDGGLTWGNDLMPGFPGDTRDSPLKGNWCNTDPVLVYDDDGTLWYSGLNYDGAREDMATVTNPQTGHDLFSGSQLYFARSNDGGATYPFLSFAAFGDDNAIFNDKQWFAAQPGGDHMIATWAQFAPFGDVIVYTESLDAGQTWLPQKVLRPGADVGGLTGTLALPALGQFSMPQYLPENLQTDLAVIWWDGGNVLYAEGLVTPGGAEFGPVQSTFPVNSLSSGSGRDGTGPTSFRLSTYPVLAVDTSGGECNGRRYVVWPDQEGGLDTDVQVLLRHSDDGLSWSAPATVNDVADGDQLMPWIDVDPNGGVHVVWYDKRNDPDNVLMDLYYGYSDDCGETFRNQRITETNFDGDLGHHQNGSPFIGDYIGVDTTAESAHLIWADTRHSCPSGSSFAECPPPMRVGSDVYTATLLHDLGARGTFDPVFG